MSIFLLFLVILAFSIFFGIGNAFNFRKKLVRLLKFKTKNESKGNHPDYRNKQSNFQEWILDYCQVKSPSELKGKLKADYEQDDWNLLESSIYSKWSKYKWNI